MRDRRTAMLESIEFKNFKALRDTTLPLQPLTLIVGPNGSGKSTVFQGIRAFVDNGEVTFDRFASKGSGGETDLDEIFLKTCWSNVLIGESTTRVWSRQGHIIAHQFRSGTHRRLDECLDVVKLLNSVRVFALDPVLLAMPHPLTTNAELSENGAGLAVVLDRLRDNHPERFESLNKQLSRWLPEFDRVLFDTPQQGQRSFRLRLASNGRAIDSKQLSQGTLLAMAILTLAYLPFPPPLVGFEEPDRGIHPRLLRDVKDALERLAYPGKFGEDRDPVQVIATTHSPYFLDLFRDQPECVVVAEKKGVEATFKRLTDIPHYEEILQDSHLGEAWYSGVLGGVPAER